MVRSLISFGCDVVNRTRILGTDSATLESNAGKSTVPSVDS